MLIFQLFGEHLKYLRETQHHTRASLSEDICSEKQLYRIENSLSSPSIYILNQLSLRLNTDLTDLYKQYNIDSLDGFKEICEITDYIKNYDMRNLRKFLSTLKVSHFKSNYLFQETYYYALASCAYVLDADYDTALFYINKGLLFNHDVPYENISKTIFSNHGYCLLNLKGNIFLQQKEYHEACSLFIEIKDSLDKHFISPKINAYLTPMFIHKIYTAVLANIVMCYYYLSDYENTIFYSDIAIKYSMNNYIMRHFQIVLDYRARAFYHKGDIREACRLFNTAITLYQMDSDYEDYICSLKKLIETDFPLISLI